MRNGKPVLALFPIGLYLGLSLLPIYFMVVTSFKDPMDINQPVPKIFPGPGEMEESEELTWRSLTFQPTLKAYKSLWDPSPQGVFAYRLFNSLVVGGISTFLAVGCGFLSAYSFSRFPVAGAKDWLFFILSTRMLPPLVVAIPISLMFRYQIGGKPILYDTRLGLIILYTVFNLSFSVWIMKGFLDEIPKTYEEAALVDGYTRFQAFWKIILPQSTTALAATAVFCLITAWNDYAFALMLTKEQATTAPPAIVSRAAGTGEVAWNEIAAGSVLFLLPVLLFTFLVRKHLLRGITFGAIRQ